MFVCLPCEKNYAITSIDRSGIVFGGRKSEYTIFHSELDIWSMERTMNFNFIVH